MEIRVLGPLGAMEAGRQIALGGRRQRSVLAGLVINAGDAVSTDRLIDFVWGQQPPPTARKSLQTYVSRLRRILGDELVEGTSDGYRLRLGAHQLDSQRFDELAEQGRGLVTSDPAAAWTVLGEALSLWRGTPLSDVDADGVVAYVERLKESRLSAIEERMAAGLALGRHTELIGELHTLVEAYPLRERLWGQLILALYRAGRQAEALGAYQRCRQTLSQELGIEPSAALQQLERRILRQDPALAIDTDTVEAKEAAVPLRNPYKGLRAFTETDAADFFGREVLVEELIGQIEAGVRFLSLVGPSGSGKSSVALAGVIPAYRARSEPARVVALMSPGTHPFAQLEAALARAAASETAVTVRLAVDDDMALLRAVLTLVPDAQAQVLLVIDQFEELLTGAIAEDTVRAFVRNLTEAVEDPHGQLTVVVTLRSDFFDRALRQHQLAGLLTAGVVHVPPLTAVELQAAVVRPARAVGLEVEPELVAELVTEAAQHPPALPLLQFVLTQLAESAPGRSLTLAALRRAGGIQGTLAQRAEQLYASLPEPGREATRRTFLGLVSVNESGEATRRVVVVDELQLPGVSDDTRRDVLDSLVGTRLLTYGRDPLSGRSTVEVTHEAVFREWPRCAGWIEDAKSDIRLAHDLERAAADWAAAEGSTDYLLTGARLQVYEDWIQHTEVGATPIATAFLDASRVRRLEQERAETARIERERTLEHRALYRLRVAAGVLALLVVVASVLSVVAVARSREAGRQRTAALAATSETLVRQLSFAAVAEAGRDPSLSLLLSLHAVRVASERGDAIPQETIEALHWGLQEMRVQYPVADADVLVLVGIEGRRGAYDLPIDALVRLARENVTRELTVDECRAFLPSGGCPRLPSDLGGNLSRVASPEAAEARPLEGTSVNIAGFDATGPVRVEYDAFTEATGINVVITENSALYSDLEAGELQRQVDLAVVPQPFAIASEAAAGRLMDLGRYLPRDQIVADYGEHLAAIGTVGADGRIGSAAGTLSALPWSAAIKSLIWYVPANFAAAGYEIPETWDELIELSDRIVADGGSPWCFAEQVGPSSGWPATDWVEDLLLREYGPAVYDAWVNREIPFTDQRVRRAFERLGQLFFTEGYVLGGDAAIDTPLGVGFFPLFDDPPGCWLYHQASFIGNLLPIGVELDADVSAFITPAITAGHEDGIVGQFSFVLVYSDRPEVRAFVRHLASPAFGAGLVDVMPAVIMPNRRFELDHYGDGWRKVAAEALARAQASDHARNDGSDTMPEWLGTGEIWSAMIDYLRGGPDSLDAILERLDAVEDPDTRP